MPEWFKTLETKKKVMAVVVIVIVIGVLLSL
jgi:hypothetical protein